MPPVRLLQASSATSSFDRFVSPPLLVSLAADLAVPLDAAAAVASAYFLAYGLAQPFWGRCSDRIGRVRTMRLTLLGAALFGALSAGTSQLGLLTLLRALTGACMAAVVPTGLVYVGDAVSAAQRHRVVTDLNAATALGITAATALGGVLAAALSWRLGFLVPAVAAAGLVAPLRRLPEPPRAPGPVSGSRAVLGSREGRLMLALALLEGAALLGLLTWFPPALESRGTSATAAGAVVALYGVGLLLASRVVKWRSARTPGPVFLGVGAGGLAAAYALAALDQNPLPVGVAALLLGCSWAAMHSTMQSWATSAVPQARAATVSLFSAALFVGSGAATAGLAPLAAGRHWSVLFAVGVVLAGLFGLVAVPARVRYPPASGSVA